jgi:hypothetical protein
MKFMLSTLFVNNEVPKIRIGAQFQSIRGYFLESKGWLFELHFYPGLFEGSESTWLISFSENAGGVVFQDLTPEAFKELKQASQWVARKSPIESYLKAHFVNQRVGDLKIANIESGEKALELTFIESKNRVRFCGGANAGTFLVECPDSRPKPFRNRVVLAEIAQGYSAKLDTPKTQSPNSDGENLKSKKWEKLIESVTSDTQSAQKELLFWSPMVEQFKLNPQNDFDFREYQSQDYFRKLFKDAPPENLNNSYKKNILEKIFGHQSKLERKFEGSKKRLEQLLKQGQESYFVSKQKTPGPSEKLSTNQTSAVESKPTQKPGL